MVPVREVVIDGDMRSPFRSSRVFRRYHLRRALSIGVLVAGDVVAFAIGATLAVVLASAIDPAVVLPGQWLARVTLVLIVAGLCLAGLYGLHRQRRRPQRIVAGLTVSLLIVVAVPLLAGRPDELLVLLSAWAIALPFWLLFRLGYEVAVGRIVGIPDGERIIMVGRFADAGRLLARLNASARTSPYHAVGEVGLDSPDLDDMIVSQAATTLLVSADPSADGSLDDVLAVSRRHHQRLLVYSSTFGDEPVCLLPGTRGPVFAVLPGRSTAFRYVLKRSFDVLAAACAVVILSPVLLVIGILVKLESPGPMIYVSWRVGACLRVFPCLKFRTMSLDADERMDDLEAMNEASGCLFKIADDPRVTRVGRFLRKTSIDELPQLFNVLAGHMSLVGPRPLPLRDVGLMDEQQKRRHVVLPGMTGLWQISGRSDLGAEEMIRLDLQYIESWALRTDFSILFRTVRSVLQHKGAY